MIKIGRSLNIQCMFWIRELFWLSFIYNFHLVASFIASEENVVPELLSRSMERRRREFISPHLTWDLFCFRSEDVEDRITVSSG